MTDQPLKHAHQHRKLGPDPIPGIDWGWPMHQWMDLGAIWNYGDFGGGSTAMIVDSLCWSNHKLQIGGINNWFTFMFLLGPQHSRHEIIYTFNRGPDFGIADFYMAQLNPDVDGFDNPLELISNSAGYGGAPDPSWVYINQQNGMYANPMTRNNVGGLHFRVLGAPGVPFTTVSTDSDGFTAIDGGPGIYAMQFRMDTKAALSSAYKCEVSQLGVHRIALGGFV